MAYTPFKMKGHFLPGINQRSEGDTNLPDGRSASSPFQQEKEKKDIDVEQIKDAVELAGEIATPVAIGGGALANIGAHAEAFWKGGTVRSHMPRPWGSSDKLTKIYRGAIFGKDVNYGKGFRKVFTKKERKFGKKLGKTAIALGSAAALTAGLGVGAHIVSGTVKKMKEKKREKK